MNKFALAIAVVSLFLGGSLAHAQEAKPGSTATKPPAAEQKIVDGIFLDNMVFPPYPAGNENVTLTSAQYRQLIGRAQIAQMGRGDWWGLDLWSAFLPVLVIFVIYLFYQRYQGRASLRALDHLSAKAEIAALHGDVKVVLERQSQLLQMLEGKS